MHDNNDLNRDRLPSVGYDVRVEVSEAEAAIKKLIMIVTDSGCTAESL